MDRNAAIHHAVHVAKANPVWRWRLNVHHQRDDAAKRLDHGNATTYAGSGSGTAPAGAVPDPLPA